MPNTDLKRIVDNNYKYKKALHWRALNFLNQIPLWWQTFLHFKQFNTRLNQFGT